MASNDFYPWPVAMIRKVFYVGTKGRNMHLSSAGAVMIIPFLALGDLGLWCKLGAFHHCARFVEVYIYFNFHFLWESMTTDDLLTYLTNALHIHWCAPVVLRWNLRKPTATREFCGILMFVSHSFLLSCNTFASVLGPQNWKEALRAPPGPSVYHTTTG